MELQKTQFKKIKSAFSLLELVVVLAIVAVMMSLGITSLVELRNRTMLKQAVDNMIQNFNTTRNSARNSVIDRGQLGTGLTDLALDKAILDQSDAIDYYAIILNYGTDGDYYKGSCKSTGVGTTYTCTFDKTAKLKGAAYESVKVNAVADTCNTIIFNMGRGNIGYLASDSSGDALSGNTITRTATSSGTPARICDLSFTFKNNTSLQTGVKIDKDTYDFKIT